MLKNYHKGALILSLITMALQMPLCLADDFPGKGDRFAWSSALPYYNLANKYLEHGRFEEAKTNFEEAIYRYEYDPDFYVNYGVALRKLESYTAAEEAFKKALELRANDWQSMSNLANAYLKQNKLKETIACFQKAMKMKPPPPPQEREAMLKDIADINKILKMQAPPPAVKAAGASKSNNSPDSSAKASTKGTAGNQSGNKIAAKSAGRSAKQSDAQNATTGSLNGGAAKGEKQNLNNSGWDWVQQ